MHRSASTSRASDEFYLSTIHGFGRSNSLPKSPTVGFRRSAVDADQHHHLPMYNQQLDMAKKEVNRAKLAESMVHMIPLVVVFCVMLLWFLSDPSADIEVLSVKDESIVARVKNMTIDGYSNWNGSSMTIGMEDLDPIDVDQDDATNQNAAAGDDDGDGGQQRE